MDTNDAASLMFKWWPQIEANKNRIITGTVIVAVLVLGYSFYSWHSQQTQIDAGTAMTQVLISVPPGTEPSQVAGHYLGISDEYGSTMAGQRALMQGSAALFMAGKFADAQSSFQRYLDSHPDGEFSGQAALGVAKCQEAQGKLDAAAGTYEHVINDLADEEAVINAQFSLALINLEQKKFDNAQQLFQKVMQVDRFGALGSEAAQYLYSMQSRTPAPASTAAPVLTPATGTPAPAKAAPFNLSH
ncbi:MAG TPA: tetratricopeptide repeat protein [Pseudomonadales bacterium]|nr:tetratricopeptide repeat protein [Pseudomonadales bacterium]